MAMEGTTLGPDRRFQCTFRRMGGPVRGFITAMFFAGVVTACVRTTPQPPPEPPPPPAPAVVVPEGCLADLGGAWASAEDPTFLYRALDDGGALTLDVHHRVFLDAGFSPRRFRPDAGAPDAGKPGKARDAGVDAGASDAGSDLDGGSDAGPDQPPSSADELPTARILLLRTDGGFVGQTSTRWVHPTGRACDVTFPTRVLSCSDGGLVLETVEVLALGDTCQPPARPAPPLLRRHALVRPEGKDGG